MNDREAENIYKPNSGEIVLRAANLGKQVSSPEGSLAILDDINLEIFGGEAVALRGDSDVKTWRMRVHAPEGGQNFYVMRVTEPQGQNQPQHKIKTVYHYDSLKDFAHRQVGRYHEQSRDGYSR